MIRFFANNQCRTKMHACTFIVQGQPTARNAKLEFHLSKLPPQTSLYCHVISICFWWTKNVV